jgi:hypothetical protein
MTIYFGIFAEAIIQYNEIDNFKDIWNYVEQCRRIGSDSFIKKYFEGET